MQLTTLRGVAFGVDQTRTSAVWINLGSKALSEPAARVIYYDRILREAESLTGIEAVGGVSLPFNIGWDSVQVRDASPTSSRDVTALARTATPSYLLASGIRLLEGRWFADSDRANAPIVAVVSESLARARWPNQAAIGQQLTAVDSSGASSVAAVIGVVADTRHLPHLPPDRIVYRAVAQEPPPWLYLIVRSRPGVQDAVKQLNDAIWRVNPDQPIDGPWPVRESIERRTVHLRFLTLVSLVLGGVGLVLSAAGLYGLTSWSVTSSRRSIAVRRAIGASDQQIRSWFISQWAKIVIPGLTGGWILQSLWTSALVAAIQGLQPPTPAMVIVGLSIMAAAAACAAILPLRRAMGADSSTLMRA
jgi:ABC-type antimicrobial peptide transport system permease subunit